MPRVVNQCVGGTPPPLVAWHALRDPWLVQPALVEGNSPLTASDVTVSKLLAVAREQEATQLAANLSTDQLVPLRVMGAPTYWYESEIREGAPFDEAPQHATQLVPPERAFQRVLDPPDNTSYAYLSLRLFHLGPSKGLWRAWGLLDVAERLIKHVESDLQTKVDNAQAWFGQAGVTATSHIDSEHNLFVQADGSKRFTLFPPAAHRRMRLYPVWHTRARQAQADLADAVADADADADGGGGWQVTLRPGDVLHIPGGVFHRAESLTPNVAFNVWYASPLLTVLPARWRLLESVALFARPSAAGGPAEAKAAQLAWATEGQAAVWLARHLHRTRLWLVLLEGLVAEVEAEVEAEAEAEAEGEDAAEKRQRQRPSTISAALASGGDSTPLAPLLASVVARGRAAARARAAALLDGRYGPAVVNGSQYRRTRGEMAPLLSALTQGCHAADAQAAPLGWRRRHAQTRALLSELHTTFAAPLLTMDEARRQMWLDDAIEHVAVWALGNVVPAADAALLRSQSPSSSPPPPPHSTAASQPMPIGAGPQRLEDLGEEKLLGAAGAETFLRECLAVPLSTGSQTDNGKKPL